MPSDLAVLFSSRRAYINTPACTYAHTYAHICNTYKQVHKYTHTSGMPEVRVTFFFHKLHDGNSDVLYISIDMPDNYSFINSTSYLFDIW